VFLIILLCFDAYVDKVDRRTELTKVGEDSKFRCQDVREFSGTFWLIIINSVVTYSGLMFYNVSNDFFMIRYGFTQVEAARLCSNTYLISIFIAPVFGLI